MYQRLEGEVAKLIQIENGWNVVIWDPEPPPTTIPGQPPCAQQPVKFWKTYSFETIDVALEFLSSFLHGEKLMQVD